MALTPTSQEVLIPKFVLNDKEINLIAQWSLIIEQHYRIAMDIEWALERKPK